MSLSECEAAGSNPDPATKTDCLPFLDVAKGGGEVNRKHRCLFKRFAALVAALLSSLCFCLPCFASNNAATFEWFVSDERQFYGENGQLTRYLQLSPFVDGKFYAATFETRFLSYLGSYPDGVSSYVTHPQLWGCPVNYPDWWRSDLPLGRDARVQFDKLTFIPDGSSSLFSGLTSVSFLPQNKAYVFDVTADNVVDNRNSPEPDVHLSGRFPFYLIYTYSQQTNNDVHDSQADAYLLCLTGKPVSFGSSSPAIYFVSEDQCVLTLNQNNLHYSYYWIDSLANASLSQIEWVVMPDVSSWSDEQILQLNNKILKVSAEVSFWIDANKLPAGLEVGDTFPAPAADPLGDLQKKLLEDYEVEKNIRDTEFWLDSSLNDFNSVDSDVASGASGLLGGLFQNLGSFLVSFSLLCLGAVVLRMVIKKAVDG